MRYRIHEMHDGKVTESIAEFRELSGPYGALEYIKSQLERNAPNNELGIVLVVG